MSADHLTAPSPDVAEIVRSILIRHHPSAAANASGLDPADLDDAVAAYHAAGAAAIEQIVNSRWQYVQISFHSADSAERVMATAVGPRLDELETAGAAASWWFLRKPAGWRIRLLDANLQATQSVLDELVAKGIATGWRPGIYEAETAAFGGPSGMTIAHELFCSDSRGVLSYLRHSNPPIGRRELSVLLINAMMTAARLDWFERGDVFDRVAQMRPQLPTANTSQLDGLTAQLRMLLTISPAHLPTTPSAVPYLRDWLTAFENSGGEFDAAASRNNLTRGIRALLAQIAIFHWNRFGLSASTQGVLARAAAAVYLKPN